MTDAPGTGTTDATTTTTTASPADAAAAAEAAKAAAAPAAGSGEPGAPVVTEPGKTAADQDPANAPWNDPAKAEAMIRQLQKEAGDRRMQAKAAETEREKAMQDAARLILGIDPEGDKAPSVEELGKAVSEQRAAAATAHAAWSNGVDPAHAELLEFKLSRNAEFKALDTTAADYQAKVGTIVAALVAADASLKTTAGPVQRSSVDNLGGTEGKSAITAEAFATMSMADRTALRNTDRATYDLLVAGQ